MIVEGSLVSAIVEGCVCMCVIVEGSLGCAVVEGFVVCVCVL